MSGSRHVARLRRRLLAQGVVLPRKKPTQRERAFQQQGFDFLDYALIPPAWSFCIPGGHKVVTTAPGYRSGFPDGGILFQGLTFFLEFKDGDDGELSDDQIVCHERLEKAGFPVAIIRRLEDIEVACFRWQIPLRAHITPTGAWVRTDPA